MTRFAQTPDANAALCPSATVVQLLYAAPPRIGFASVLGKVCEVLGAGLGLTVCMTAITQDAAEMELGDHRLILRLDRTPPGPAAACLTFGLGPHAGRVCPSAAAHMARQTEIARKLTEAVTRHLPADQVLWHIAPQPLTAALIDDLTARLPQSLSHSVSLSPAADDAAGSDETVDLLRVMEQVQVSLAARAPIHGRPGGTRHVGRRPGAPLPLWLTPTILTPAPEPVLQAPANETPALPRPDPSGRLRCHRALEAACRAGDRRADRTRAVIRLILTMGQSTACVEAAPLRAG